MSPPARVIMPAIRMVSISINGDQHDDRFDELIVEVEQIKTRLQNQRHEEQNDRGLPFVSMT